MTAKEYLMQLQLLDLKITQKVQETAQLRSMVTGRGLAISEKVQTSPKNSQEGIITKYMDLEEKIDSMIDHYVMKKDFIIDQIHQLTDPRFVRILYDRYVPDEQHKVKSLERIAVEMNYNYDHVRHLHGFALQEFQRTVMQVRT